MRLEIWHSIGLSGNFVCDLVVMHAITGLESHRSGVALVMRQTPVVYPSTGSQPKRGEISTMPTLLTGHGTVYKSKQNHGQVQWLTSKEHILLLLLLLRPASFPGQPG